MFIDIIRLLKKLCNSQRCSSCVGRNLNSKTEWKYQMTVTEGGGGGGGEEEEEEEAYIVFRDHAT